MNRLVFFAAIFALAGCTSLNDPRGKDAVKSELNTPVDNQASQSCCRENDPHVRDLPKEVEKALTKVGIKDVVFIAAIDNEGNVRLLKPENVKHDRVNLDQDNPLPNKGITGLNSISIVSYKSSLCFIYQDGTMVDKKGNIIKKGTASGIVLGGSGLPERFCKAYYK